MNEAQFLAIFGEFSNVSVYPTAMISFWLGVAANFINPTRWGNLAQQGQALLTAHYLVLAQRIATEQAAQNATNGASTMGLTQGVITAKSVDGVSVNMDVGAVTMEGAGAYNRTSYGIQYYQLAQMFGAGGLQINAGS